MRKNHLFMTMSLALVTLALNSCDNSGEETSPCDNGPEASIGKKVATTTGKSAGSFTVNVSGGEAPFQYSIDGTSFQGSNTFTDLAADTYTVTVKDANNCSDEEDVIIVSVQEVSYASQIRPILDTNCQISGCHGSNGSIPTFSNYNNVKANADRIKTVTGNKSMPIGRTLTATQIKLVADWVDQDAPNN